MTFLSGKNFLGDVFQERMTWSVKHIQCMSTRFCTDAAILPKAIMNTEES